MTSHSRIGRNRRPEHFAEGVTGAVRGSCDAAAGAVRESYDAAAGVVTDNPAKSILIVFGVGFSLGLLLGHALGEPPREESSVNRLGRQMLDRMAQLMPESVSKHWHG